MATHPRLAALALALSLVLAGCAGESGAFRTTEPETETTPIRTDTETPTRTTAVEVTGEYSVPVTGDELPIDADRTFARVQALVGTNVEPQPVRVRDGSTRTGEAEYYSQRPFFRVMGLAEANYTTVGASGVTYSDGEVQITTRDASPAEVERVLAHEFAHTVQMRTSMTAELDATGFGDRATDSAMTRRALVEGGAVYVTDTYAERFQNRTVYQSNVVERQYERGPSGNRYLWGPYHFGYRYVADTIDSPAELETVYEDFPRTTEQLLHGYAPDEEPVADLVFRDTVDDWYRTDTDTKGELVTRIVLRGELSKDSAAAAAAGWGNDRVAVYERASGGATGIAWALRMDDRGEATEAVDAFEAYADRQTESSFRVERVTARTFVVLAGDGAFVDNARVSAEGARVTVGIDDPRASLTPPGPTGAVDAPPATVA